MQNTYFKLLVMADRDQSCFELDLTEVAHSGCGVLAAAAAAAGSGGQAPVTTRTLVLGVLMIDNRSLVVVQ